MADWVEKKTFVMPTHVLFGTAPEYVNDEKPRYWTGTQLEWEQREALKDFNNRVEREKHSRGRRAIEERNGDLNADFFNELGKTSIDDEERDAYKRTLNTKAKWKAEKERELKLVKQMKKYPKHFEQKEHEPYYGFFKERSDGEKSFGEKMIDHYRQAQYAQDVHHSLQGHYPAKRGGRKTNRRRHSRVSRRKHKKTTRRR